MLRDSSRAPRHGTKRPPHHAGPALAVVLLLATLGCARHFKVDSTWSRGQRRWSPVFVQGFEHIPDHRDTENDVAFDVLGLPSPDGRYILDVDSYQVVEPEGDSLEWGGEPESRPVLIDRREKIAAILAVCGTPCWFDWGTWLSPTSFALAGAQDADEFGEWRQGRVTIYSISDSTAATYVTRIVPADTYARYVKAWKSWLMKRFRALKASRPTT